MNLFGLVDAVRFDASQPKELRTAVWLPDCGTVLVLGTGGRDFWQQHGNGCGAGAGSAQRAQEIAMLHAGRVAGLLARVGLRGRLVGPEERRGPSFARLGEAAGFGTVSPVTGLLLHPEYGPWLSLRAALFVEGKPFGAIADASITDRFQPCCTCDKPCVSACPVSVHDGLGHQDLERCAEHRHAGNCESGCQTRLACPVGSEHRDAPGEAAHCHAHPLSTMQRWFGLGVWRLLPRFLRG